MKTNRFALCVAIGALFLIALPAPADAQDKSRSRGFFIGVGYEGNAVAVEDSDETDSGPGFGVTFGYGFTKNLALYGQWSGANIDDGFGGEYGIGHFDIGARVHFLAPEKRAVPFFQAGLSSRAYRQDFGVDEIEGSGFGFAVGGGVNVHFTPAVAFTAGVTWSIGDIGDFKVNGTAVPGDSFGATSARIHLGIVFFVQAK